MFIMSVLHNAIIVFKRLDLSFQLLNQAIEMCYKSLHLSSSCTKKYYESNNMENLLPKDKLYVW